MGDSNTPLLPAELPEFDYRAGNPRSGPTRHALHTELLLLLLFATGCVSDPPPAPLATSLTIEMTAHNFQWHSRYAGEDGQLGTTDDAQVAQVLHAPVGADVEFMLKSQDYVYSLEVPQAGRAEIAVPDLTFSLQFTVDQIGTFELPGNQLCGYTHPDLMGTLVVESQENYAGWLRSCPFSCQ